MYLEQLPDDNVAYITTSHSLDNLYDYCTRKFEFLALYDKRPKRESGYAADVGTALHEALQEYLRSRANGLDEDACVVRAYFALMQWFPWNREFEQHASTRSFENTNLLLYKLIRLNIWDDWSLVWVNGRGWATEVAFRIRHDSFGDIPVAHQKRVVRLASQGKIDMVMRHNTTGEIATFDLKTTITDDDALEANYKFSGQQVGYSQVVQSLLNEPLGRFKVYYILGQFSAQIEPRAHVMEFKKDQDDIDDYWLTKLDRLNRMRTHIESGWFPRTSGGCVSWNAPCQFLDICSSRNYKFINRWFDTIDTEQQQGYDYWVDLAI